MCTIQRLFSDCWLREIFWTWLLLLSMQWQFSKHILTEPDKLYSTLCTCLFLSLHFTFHFECLHFSCWPFTDCVRLFCCCFCFFFKLALRLCRRSRIILIIWISWETNFYQLAFTLWHVEETGMLTLIRIISEAEEMFEQRQYSQTNKLKIYLRTEELVLRIKRLSHKHVSILESWKSKLGVASDYNPSTPEVDTGISWESWLARLPKIF